MSNPFLKFVHDIQAATEAGKGLCVSGRRDTTTADSKVLLFSPHPDDECIFGLLPLRLQQEKGMQIINIPVTFGSNRERRESRAKELDDACSYLGWNCHHQHDDLKDLEVEDVINLLENYKPDVIFFPHADDWNSRHISTHHLVVKTLKKLKNFSCLTVETEFWGAMDDPNLMVEGNANQVAELVSATSLHVGEVARNPYHLFLPAWMQDNVRRGSELVGGQGGKVPSFSFATLYRLRKWEDRNFVNVLKAGKSIPVGEQSLSQIFS